MAGNSPNPNVIDKSWSEGRLAEIVSAAYEACLNDQNWLNVLRLASAAMNADGAALISYDTEINHGRIYKAFGLRPGFKRSYADRYGANDVWMRSLRTSNGKGQARLGQQLVSESVLVSSEFYREWLAPQNFFHSMRIVLLCWEDSPLTLMLYRAEENGAFGDAEIDACRKLVPHLQRAFNIRKTLSLSHQHRDAALGALNHLPFGVMLLDENGRVLELNSCADEILSMNDGIKIARDGLRAASHEETVQLRQFVAHKVARSRNGNGKIGDTMLVTRPSGEPPFNVLVTTLAVGGRFLGKSRRAAAVFITNPGRYLEFNQSRLQTLYQLTPAEARIASLIAQGCRLEDAAEELGISLNTVRTHLKRIFVKSGTDRQVDLVRLLLSGPAQIATDLAIDRSKGLEPSET